MNEGEQLYTMGRSHGRSRRSRTRSNSRETTSRYTPAPRSRARHRDERERSSRRQRERSREQSRSKHDRQRSPIDLRTPSVDSSSDWQGAFQKLIETVAIVSEKQGPREPTEGKRSIPLFDPSQKNQTVEVWIQKVEELKKIHGWSDTAVSSFALENLRGVAKTWYDGLTTVDFSWTEWKEKLFEAFTDHTLLPEKLSIMLARMKTRNESMMKFFFEKAALVRSCGFEGKDAADCIAQGISDQSLRNTIRQNSFETPEALRIFLSKTDTTTERSVDVCAGTKDNNRAWQDRNGRDRRKPKWAPRYEHKDKRGPSESAGGPANKLTTMRCFRCNEVGHMSRQCPKMKEEAVRNVRSIGNGQRGGDMRLHDAVLNDTPLRAYIDGGSECVTLKKSEADKMRLHLQPTDVILRGYGGGEVRPHGTVKASMKIDLAEGLVDVLVVPDEIQEVPLIVGQPFLGLPGITTVQRDGDLRLFDASLATLPEMDQLPPRKLTLRAVEEAIIPPRHGADIKVAVQNDYSGDLYVELSVRSEEGREYCIPRCVIDANSAVLPIINLSDQSLTIRKDIVIARAELAKPDAAAENEIPVVCRIEGQENDRLPKHQINVDPSVSEDIKRSLFELLDLYRDCFALNISELGATQAAEIQIELTSDSVVTYRPYRLSYSERENVSKIIDELKENKIVRDSNSPFSSPILLVRKKNGEIRMCVDYRALNAITKKDRYPLPLIEDQLNSLQGSACFTSLDLASGYYQIPVAEKSIEKTSFVTPDGQYEFLRMPFGLANAPAVFQRLINRIVSPLKGQISVLAYMDDILIPSKDAMSGLHALELVLRALRDAGLKLKLSKCTFLETKVDYLGYEVTQQGIRPGSHKIDAVENFRVPSNVHGVRQFIGLASYFRKFIKDFATIARPLTKLTKKAVAWCWGNEQQRAFDILKQRLISRPILAIYKQGAEIELHTDASQLGLGGILLQQQTENDLKPIAYFSRQTTKEEQKYHSYELETLAVVSSLQRFRVYLLGVRFKIVSDCSALRATFIKRDLLPRVARWWIQLQEFDCSIEYRAGKKMPHVDALSRNPDGTANELKDIDDVGLLHIELGDWLLIAQLQDPRLKYVHEVLNREAKDAEESQIKSDYALKDNRVFRKTPDGLKWAVPKAARQKIVRLCHDEMGHFGVSKTLEKLQADYWFASMRRYVRRYVATCLECLYHKEPAGKRPGHLHSIEKVSMPMHTVHIDHLGPFVKSTTNNSYLLVVVEAFTKFVFAKAVKNTKTIFVERLLTSISETFGFPQRIISDRGSAFTSKKFEEFCNERGIKHVATAVATPRANGQVERYNRTILSTLAASLSEEKRWDWDVPRVVWGLNNTVNKATGKCPSELLLGYRPRNAVESQILNSIGEPRYDGDRDKTREAAGEVIRRNQSEQETRFNKRRAPPRKFSCGDIVVTRRITCSNDGASKKLLPKYAGPYQVTRVLDRDRYVIEDVKGAQRTQKPYCGVVPGEKLKPWNTGISDTESDGSEDDLQAPGLSETHGVEGKQYARAVTDPE